MTGMGLGIMAGLIGQALDLPDPLRTDAGKRVESRGEWTKLRAPELRERFQTHMYGRMFPAVSGRSEILYVAPLPGGGMVEEHRVTFAETAPGRPAPPTLFVLLALPNRPPGKTVGVFVGSNFIGNHAVVADGGIQLPEVWVPNGPPGVVGNRASDKSRGTQAEVWNVPLILSRGYGLATVYCGDMAPDHPGGHDAMRKAFGVAPGPEAGATIAAWAWGLSRVADMLKADPRIDAKRLAVVGHSRLGKTALLAAAFDKSFSICIPSQAGCGGTAPSRGKVGESVKQINDRFPHWFCDRFKEFNADPSKLPFDQHELAALVAPRNLLFSNATEDTWANPDGQYEVLKAAAPVYQLWVEKTDLPVARPEPGKLVGGSVAYFIRPGKHSMNAVDWRAWLDYANTRWGR